MLGTLHAGLSGVAAASAFVPTNIGGCKLWLRADLGVTGSSPVTAWADQSGTGNNVVSAVGSVTLNASSIGGKPAMTFDGSASLRGSANPVTGARTVFVVMKASSPVSGPGSGILGCLIDFRSSGLEHGYFYGNSAGTIYAYGDGVVDKYTNTLSFDNNAHILRFSEDGANTGGIVYKIDSTTCTLTANAQGAETGAAGFSLGRRDAYGIQGFVGDIAEVAVYDSVLSAPNQAALLTYGQARYGL